MNQIRIGAAISYGALAINILTGIFYTPWMISSIGRENFGLYTLAMSIISLFIFDFGLSTAVTRFIAKYIVIERQDLANRLLGMVYKLYLFIDILLFIVLVSIYFWIPTIYKELSVDEIEKFKVVYVIATVFSVISFPFIPVNGILTAHEKIIPLKLSDVIQKLFILFSMTIALTLGGGLYALVMINALSGLLCISIKVWCIYRYTSQRIVWYSTNKVELKSLISFSGWVSVLALAQRCIFNIAPSILGMFSGSIAIAILGLAITIEGYCFTFANAINGIFLPRVSRILLKDGGDILPLMIKVGRIQLMIIAFIVISFICFGSAFISIWVSDGFKDSYTCAVLLVIPSLFHLPQMIGNEAIYAKNEVKRLAIVYIVMALCNILGAYILSPFWGAIGISISICVAYFVRTIGMDFILCKYLNIDIFSFFHHTFVKMLPVLIMTTLIGLLFSEYLYCTSWGRLSLWLVILGIIYISSLYIWVMNDFEKELIVVPFRILFRNHGR